ncbi:unnamed protein product [Mytilus edulis]|uniref:Uncharacterized protein n=1 Tax=Mytilus edulis TaxID=6550 RepID=A0A8S3TXJ6_MYTED|nr:unnamed protein product [Mytilus edulis]
MATGDNLTLGGNWQTFYSFDNCRYAIMYRYITGNYCEILPDSTISDTLADHVPNLGEACTCCVCRRYSSIIVTASSCANDSTDSVIMSMTGDDETQMPSFSRTDMYLPEKSFQSFEFDDFDSQLLFEPEGADGISFSDAETQCPTNLSHVHASGELINATNSKTEIEIPSEVQETSIFIGLKMKQNEESSDSDTGSSHSERLLKRMK